MNKKGKSITSITLATLMIVSIFAILPLPIASTDGCDAQPGALIVDIVTPADNDTFTACTYFYVDAAIANSFGVDLAGVTATINITNMTGNATLVREDETKSIGAILSHEVTDVWWELHCTKAGTVSINVTATDGTHNSSEEITVIQEAEPVTPVLEVDIFQYPTETVDVSDEFGIKANITNNGTITATNVTANITWTPGELANLVGLMDPIALGDMEPGDQQEVGWTVHCNGSGDVNISVNATADNLNKTGQIINDTVTVHQKTPAELEVVITAPENGSKICTNCAFNGFMVNATITNNGDVTAKTVRGEINATIGADNVSIEGTPATGGPFMKSLPNIPGGGSVTVSWNVTCTGGADYPVEFEVKGIGYDLETSTKTEDDDSVTIYQKDLVVDITSPANDSKFSSCQYFDVVATIQNCRDEVIGGGTVVTFDFSQLGANFRGSPYVYVTSKPKADWADSYPMVLVESGVYNVTFPMSFCPCCWAELTWHMECMNGSVSGPIIVNTTKGNLTDEDSVYINQEWKADLAAGIVTFPGTLDLEAPETDDFIAEASDAFPVGQNYSLVVPVTNWGDADAEDVSVTINVDGLVTPNGILTQDVGTIPGGETRKAIWTLHCDGKGPVTFEIPSDGLTGNDKNTGMSVLSNNIHIPCPKTVKQIPFTVKILEPETCNDFLIGQQWTVKAQITNNDTELTLKDVNATLHWTGNATNITGQPVTISIEDLKPGKYSKVTWQMNCTGPGEVFLWVEVTSTEPEFTIYSTPMVNVHQKKRANVTIDIVSPENNTCIETCQEFMVTATLKDELGCLNATVTGAKVNIYGEGSATVVSEPEVPFNLSGDGKLVTKSWALHCDEHGITNINITVNGTDSAGKTFSETSDTVYVEQKAAAHLVVDVTAPENGKEVVKDTDFKVFATVTNTGEADAWGVTATLSTDNTNLHLAEPATQYVGSIVGHGQDGTVEVNWTVQAEEYGKSTITIDVAGRDESGGCGCISCIPCVLPAPNSPIMPRRIEPGSIVVKVVSEEELATEFDDNVTLKAGWNFISVPKKLDPDTKGDVLAGIDYAIMLSYNAATGTFSVMTGTDKIEPLDGYWLSTSYMDEQTIVLSYKTADPFETPPSKALTGEEWNAIGFSSTVSKSASTTLKSVEGLWITVLGWDETAQQYESAIIYDVSDGELMNPGKGYWLWMTEDKVLSAISA